MPKDPDPKDFDDPDKLHRIAANARRLGRDDIAWACMARIAELSGSEFSEILEKEFWRAVTMAEELKTIENGRTTRLSRTRQKYSRDGAKKCIVDLATRKGFTDGFRILHDNDKLYLTFEAVLLRNADLFDASEVDAVKSKLRRAGISLSDLGERP